MHSPHSTHPKSKGSFFLFDAFRNLIYSDDSGPSHLAEVSPRKRRLPVSDPALGNLSLLSLAIVLHTLMKPAGMVSSETLRQTNPLRHSLLLVHSCWLSIHEACAVVAIASSIVGSLPVTALFGGGVGIALDGFGVGLLVGPLVGEEVGVFVGGSVGLLLGKLVGATVGVVVGVLVGTRVGALVGISVGLLVGTLVGKRVGPEVGTLVGRLVGTLVGYKVGDGVGRLEGKEVGTTARSSRTRTTASLVP